MNCKINYRAATVEDSLLINSFAVHEFARNFGHLFDSKDLSFYFENSLNQKTFIDWVTNPAYKCLIAVDDASSNIVGYALGGPCSLSITNLKPNSGEIKKMYLEPNQFGKGTGEELLNLLINQLNDIYNGELYLSVWSQNPRALKFYQKHNFKKISEYDHVMIGDIVSTSFIFHYTL
jgi:ribosomal protein S18 acetylase RimI-like enzyme